MDTPEDSLPDLLPKEIVPIVFSMLEKIDKNLTDLFFTLSLNKNLGTEGLDISGIAAEASKQGMNLS